MMKPDTPKFAPDSLEFHAQRLVEHYDMAQNADHRSCFQDAVHCLRDKLSRIAAAPKPDCVGVDALKLEILKAANEWPYSKGRIQKSSVLWTINYLASRGLLAVKEKAHD